MAREIRVGGVKYMLAGSNEQGNVYVISPESAPVAPDPIKTEVSTEEVRKYFINHKHLNNLVDWNEIK